MLGRLGVHRYSYVLLAGATPPAHLSGATLRGPDNPSGGAIGVAWVVYHNGGTTLPLVRRLG